MFRKGGEKGLPKDLWASGILYNNRLHCGLSICATCPSKTGSDRHRHEGGRLLCIRQELQRNTTARERHHVLEVLSTASAENIKLLEAETGGVDVAFLQGGTGTLATSDDLDHWEAYLEPLWIFYRAHLSVKQISDLKGKRIAVGREGSGTRVLSMQLLEVNGIRSQIFSSRGWEQSCKDALRR